MCFPTHAIAQYRLAVTSERLSPVPASELNRPVPPLTAAQRKAMIDRYYARREAMDAANSIPADKRRNFTALPDRR